MDYSEVIGRAWKIIWKNKVLWLFGILASCATRTGGGGTGSGSRFTGNAPFNPGQGLPQVFQGLQRTFESIPFWVYILAAILFLLLFVLILFLSTVGRIGVIRGTIEGDEGAERLSFGPLFQRSLPYFWRIFLLNLLLMVLGLIVFFILLIPTIGLAVLTLGIGLICLLPLFCVLGILFWVVGIVLEQATVAIVAENLGVIQGLERGWGVVRAYPGQVLVIALLILIVGGIIGFIIGLPFLIVIAPLAFGYIMNTQASMNIGVTVALAFVCIYLPIVIVLRGMIESYIEALWTLTFRRLTGVKPGVMPASPELPTGAAVY
jgi:hypothetical protein